MDYAITLAPSSYERLRNSATVQPVIIKPYTQITVQRNANQPPFDTTIDEIAAPTSDALEARVQLDEFRGIGHGNDPDSHRPGSTPDRLQNQSLGKGSAMAIGRVSHRPPSPGPSICSRFPRSGAARTAVPAFPQSGCERHFPLKVSVRPADSPCGCCTSHIRNGTFRWAPISWIRFQGLVGRPRVRGSYRERSVRVLTNTERFDPAASLIAPAPPRVTGPRQGQAAALRREESGVELLEIETMPGCGTIPLDLDTVLTAALTGGAGRREGVIGGWPAGRSSVRPCIRGGTDPGRRPIHRSHRRPPRGGRNA